MYDLRGCPRITSRFAHQRSPEPGRACPELAIPGERDKKLVSRQLLSNYLRCEQASSLLELALTLPILLFLLLGVMDLGLGLRAYGGLTNAAHEGARWVTTHPTDLNGAVARVAAEADAAGVAASGVTVTLLPMQSSYQVGDTVTVRVQYAYPTLFGALTALPTIPMTVDVTMQVLYE